MNLKFGLTIAKQLRKPVVRKKIEEQDKKTIKKTNNNASENEDVLVTKDLVQINMA